MQDFNAKARVYCDFISSTIAINTFTKNGGTIKVQLAKAIVVNNLSATLYNMLTFLEANYSYKTKCYKEKEKEHVPAVP